MAHNGRFGPYLKRGADTRSLASEDQLLTVTLHEAQALFAQPKQRRGRAAAAPLRELGTDPTTNLPVVREGGALRPLRDRRHHQRQPAQGRRRWSRSPSSGPPSCWPSAGPPALDAQEEGGQEGGAGQEGNRDEEGHGRRRPRERRRHGSEEGNGAKKAAGTPTAPKAEAADPAAMKAAPTEPF